MLIFQLLFAILSIFQVPIVNLKYLTLIQNLKSMKKRTFLFLLAVSYLFVSCRKSNSIQDVLVSLQPALSGMVSTSIEGNFISLRSRNNELTLVKVDANDKTKAEQLVVLAFDRGRGKDFSFSNKIAKILILEGGRRMVLVSTELKSPLFIGLDEAASKSTFSRIKEQVNIDSSFCYGISVMKGGWDLSKIQQIGKDDRDVFDVIEEAKTGYVNQESPNAKNELAYVPGDPDGGTASSCDSGGQGSTECSASGPGGYSCTVKCAWPKSACCKKDGTSCRCVFME